VLVIKGFLEYILALLIIFSLKLVYQLVYVVVVTLTDGVIVVVAKASLIKVNHIGEFYS